VEGRRAPPGFEAAVKYSAIHEGKTIDVDLIQSDGSRVEAEVEGIRYVLDVDAVEPGVFWILSNHRSIEVSVAAHGDAYSVSVQGDRTEVEILDARAALRKAARQGRGGTAELRAPMPGKIVKVLVSEGSAVEINQGIVVIEAMKMQNELKSPRAGVVTKIGVREADAVNSGDLVAVVE
jgi:biotin carboxyl carrier protein